MPTGRVKWYGKEKGFGFVTSDDGGDVFVPKTALPSGVDDLKAGQRVEFSIVDSRKGAQAMSLQLLEAPPSVAELRRRPAEGTSPYGIIGPRGPTRRACSWAGRRLWWPRPLHS